VIKQQVEHAGGVEAKEYHVLLILTDGAVSDVKQTTRYVSSKLLGLCQVTSKVPGMCPGLCQADNKVCVKQTTRSVSSRQQGLCQADYQVPCSLLQCQCVAACCSVLQRVVRLGGLETSVLSDATGVCVASLLSDATGACAIRVPSHSYQ